ncbi:MAG: hypothetical protein IJS78_05560 [Clostridia bacterium]|nr:hypothetical protein [Clostridia bacterium]
MVFYRFPGGGAVRAVPRGCVAVLGFFDGVHPGHRELVRVARSFGRPVVAWTFFSGSRTGLLTDDETRFRLLGEAGVDFVAAADFEKLRDTDGPSFVKTRLLRELGISRAVFGDSFRFGKGAAWGADDLVALCREAGIGCTVVPTVLSRGVPVSSSTLRKMISAGDAEEAARLLGRAHFYRLPVVRGKMLGRLLGFPTANQIIPRELLTPARGVYVCLASFEEDGKELRFPGVLNVGVCPTLTGEELARFKRDNPDYDLPDESILGSEVMETHMIGYSGDIYGRTLRVDLLRYLRPEKKFPSTDDLRSSILNDEKDALAYFETRPDIK